MVDVDLRGWIKDHLTDWEGTPLGVSVRTFPETVRPGGPKKGSVSCWIQNLNV